MRCIFRDFFVPAEHLWACDRDDSPGYRQSRVYGYPYAPRAYGYYAPAYGYRTAYLDR